MRDRLFALLGLLIVVLAVGATVAHEVRKSDKWTPDGYLYARMMLVDTGMSDDAAHAEASRFYRSTSAGHDPDERGFYEPRSPDWFEAQYPLFRARPLYPWLAAQLYPHAGFRALKIVPAIGVIVAAGALYVLLLSIAPWWLAVCGAIAGAAAVGETAVLALSDGSALAWWTIALAAMAAYARKPTVTALVVCIAATALFAMTRPALWIPLGAAAGLAVAAYRSGDAARRRSATIMLGAQFAVALGALAFTAAVHGAGFFTLLHWSYDWQRTVGGTYVGHGLVVWYLSLVLRDIWIEPATLVIRGTPLLALAIGAIGIAARRHDPIVPVLLGVACVAPLAILVNPPDPSRALELPLTPVVMTAVIAAAAAALRVARFGEAAADRV